jgi:hypothetical protein
MTNKNPAQILDDYLFPDALPEDIPDETEWHLIF